MAKKKKHNGKHSNAFNTCDEFYDFRFNEITSNFEYKKVESKKWKFFDDRARADILLWLMDRSQELSKMHFDIYVESPRTSPRYNPFEKYFDKLKKWDGKKDYLKKLAKTVDADNKEQFELCFKKFMVGTVDCLLNAESVNDTCLVFQAGQGEGKSRWMRRLLPKGFAEHYFWEGQIDTKNKDHTMYLSQYWFMHLDELEGLKTQDVSNLKSYITRQRISLRQAYGRHKSNFVRRASFIGSVNNDKFLTDTTGNRRWLVFKVGDIDYMHNIDVNKAWAQAYSMYKEGYRHWFNKEEIVALNENNGGFGELGLVEELFLRHFAVNNQDEAGDWLSASEVMEKLVEAKPASNNKLNVFRVGRVLSKYVKQKKRTNNMTKYYVEYIMEEHHLDSPQGVEYLDEDDDVPF